MPRELSEDFAGGESVPGRGVVGERYAGSRRFSGLRFRIAGGVPGSVAGRVAAGAVVLAALAGFTAVVWGARTMLLEDPRLVIPSSASIQIGGNRHLSRPQLLSVFGEDVERNVLTVPLGERRAELERLPWVEHAAVMRLLPHTLRVQIVERTPVAFARQGGRVGLVDASGVLLDHSPETAAEDHYSFAVITGISADEPLSTRAARMKLYARFLRELDEGGTGISQKLSEVDLSNPEDVKALLPSGAAEILVHFGDAEFLTRYRRYEQNLPGWQAQYPKLAAVDMRYERQVVLQMQPGTSIPVTEKGGEGTVPTEKKTAGKAVGKAGAHALAAKSAGVHPAGGGSAPAGLRAGGHLTTAFPVHAKAEDGAPRAHEPQEVPQ